ncbi:hypothetical protein ACPV5O_26340 [Vibrio maritimus]|uniref:hypothetical protein n=1 Tax=Vibrio maritimus TaxID=990268 RepID=UPI004068C956
MRELTLSLLFLLCSSFSHATDFEEGHYAWGAKGDSSAANIEIISEEPRLFRGVIGGIAHDDFDGAQRLGLLIITNVAEEMCSEDESRGVVKINEQPIRVALDCKVAPNRMLTMLAMIPLTEEGKEFVHNAFEHADGRDVTIKHHNQIHSLTSKDFVNVWNQQGGNAL